MYFAGEKINMYQFKITFRSFLCSPSKSCKTNFLTSIIHNRVKMFLENPRNIYSCYFLWQYSIIPMYNNIIYKS